jgi:polyhydroxybutyrate depolymerase
MEKLIAAKIETMLAALATWMLACAIAPPLQAEQLIWKQIQIEGKQRRFLIDRPASFDDAYGRSVLLVIHGFGSNPSTARTEMGFSKLNNRDDFIFVFPEGSGPDPNELSWNAGFCCRSAMQNGVDDVNFLDQVLDMLMTEMHIDRRRVYVAGFSNGAHLAYRWGAARSQTVAGIAAVAGAIGGRASFFAPEVRISNPKQPVSLLVVHGKEDLSFPYEGGASLAIRPGLRGRRSVSVPDSISFWKRNDGCIGEPQISKTAGEGSLQRFAQCLNGTAVEAWTFARLGHEWPKQLDQLVSRPFVTEYMLEFFRRHPKVAEAP